DAALYQELAGHLIYPHPGFKGLAPKGKEIELGQNELWSMGISGDYPILLATLEAPAGLSSVRQLLRVHHYWRLKGLACDLVILSLHPPTYLQELNDELLSTVLASSESGFLDRPGGVFIRRADLLKPENIELLYSIARIQVDCDGLGLGNFLEFPHIEDNYTARVGTPLAEPLPRVALAKTISTQVSELIPASGRFPAVASSNNPEPVMESSPTPATEPVIGAGLDHFNGTGGFNQEGEYEIRLTGDSLPPAPWVNVMGNPVCGCLISEAGSGATWASNSSFRLTPWNNDPVEDPPGECIYIHDHDNGDLWSATPEPIREKTPYTVRHGAGYSVFEHEHAGISTSLRVGLPKDDPLKIGVLTIVNSGTTIRRLHVTSYVEWLLGTDREKTQQHVRTKVDEDSSAMLARSCFDPQFSSLVAFTALSDPLATYTAARREFIGRNGTLAAPAALSRNG